MVTDTTKSAEIKPETTARITTDARRAGVLSPDDELLGWLALAGPGGMAGSRISYLLVTQRQVILTSWVSGLKTSGLSHMGFSAETRVLRLDRPQDVRLQKPAGRHAWTGNKILLTTELANFLGRDTALPAKSYHGAAHSDEAVDQVLQIARTAPA